MVATICKTSMYWGEMENGIDGQEPGTNVFQKCGRLNFWA